MWAEKAAVAAHVGDRVEHNPRMAIHWFTDRDRQDMRDAEEERAVLEALERKYATETPDVPMTPELIRKLEDRIDPRSRG